MNEMNPDYRDYDRDYRDYDYRYDRDYRDYDRRGGRRNYRNYREDYHEELEMITEGIRKHYRHLEDVAEMATNMQDKNAIMRVAQKEKENYMTLKQISEK